MQEGKKTVSSFTFEINFSGYRRVFLSDYSGREMRPASLFLKISKKWDAQWDGSPMYSLFNPRNFPFPIPRIPSKKCDGPASETEIPRKRPLVVRFRFNEYKSHIDLIVKHKKSTSRDKWFVFKIQAEKVHWKRIDYNRSPVLIFQPYCFCMHQSEPNQEKASQNLFLASLNYGLPMLKETSTNYND